MHKSNKQAHANVQLYIYDILIVGFSYLLSYLIAYQITTLNDIHEYMWILIIYIPLFILIMNNSGMYNNTTFMYYDRILRNILFSSLLSGLFIAAMIFFIKEDTFSRILYMSFLITCITLLVIARYIYTFVIRKHSKNGIKNIIIIGNSRIADKFIYYLGKTDILINIVEYIRIDSKKQLEDQIRLGTLIALDEILKEKVIDEVIFAVPKNYISEVEKYALICEEMGVTISMVLDLYKFKVARTCLTSIGTLPMLTFHTVCLNSFQLFSKRLIDIVGSIVGLLITSAVSIFIIPAIKIDSRGPILFCQERVGINGRKFKLYKFRSMTVDAEDRKKQLLSQNEVSGNLMFKIKNDPRITNVGRFLRASSLDELPQFINVLKGEMSLVGTRPPTCDEVNQYENHHWRRISIKPGLTGMWQVSGRSEITDFDEVVKLDTQYIDNWSVWLDIKIIFKTFKTVFSKKGAM
ncbi:MAG: sugar transferase [Clostridia bacterium]|nr:sugar transferase [Clostridia bacterium]